MGKIKELLNTLETASNISFDIANDYLKNAKIGNTDINKSMSYLYFDFSKRIDEIKETINDLSEGMTD